MAEKGVVTKVDGTKIKLKVPAITGGLETDWTSPAAPGYGIPLVGEQVWVIYDHDDVTKPIYIPKAKRTAKLIEETSSSTLVNFSSTTPVDIGLSLTWNSIIGYRYTIDYFVNFSYGPTSGTLLWGRVQAFTTGGGGFPVMGLNSGYVPTFSGSAPTTARGNDSYLETSTQQKFVKLSMNAPTGQSATLTFLNGYLRIWDKGEE